MQGRAVQESETNLSYRAVQPVPWARVLVLLAVIAACYLVLAGRSTLWDRDEPRFSRATVEMIESGHYLVPTFNGRLRPDKPILIYWLMSVPIRVFGTNAFACRFFAAIGTGLTCLFTFLIGIRLMDARAAFWSVAVLASSLLCLVVGTAATADAVLLPWMTAVMAIFVWAWYKGRFGFWDVLGMGMAFGLALLAKGPVGLLPVAVIATILILLRRQQSGLARRFVVPLAVSVLIGSILFLAWGIPANLATGGEFLRLGIGHHVLGRSARPLEGHGGKFLLFLPYYPLVILGAFFPWSLHLFGGFSHALSGRLGGATGRAILIGWVVPIVLIMTFVATKLPHYVLFTWPALALMVGGTLTTAQEGSLNDTTRRWLRRGEWAFGPLALAASLGAIVAPWFLPMPALRVWGAVCGVVLAGMAILAIRYQLGDMTYRSAKVLVAGMLLLLILLLVGVLPILEEIKIPPHLAKVIVEKTDPNTPVATFAFAEPSLNFYIGRQIEPLKTKEDAAAWLRQVGPGVLIVPKDTFAQLVEEHGPFPAEPIASVKGINYSKGKEVEVLAVRRTAPAGAP